MILGRLFGAGTLLLGALATPANAPHQNGVEPSNGPSELVLAEPKTPVASYQLSARLDEKRHLVRGSGTIRFENSSTAKLSELYFHLYLNAFSNSETLFLREKGGRSGSRSGIRGKTTVLSLTSPTFGKGNLWEDASKHSPGDPRDATDIRVPLPTPIRPGQTVEFTVEFESQLPELVERTGFEKDFHLIAQWFPKLAKLEADGTWAHFAFHPFGEFYADFGNYDVSLDVPSSYVVGSTGALRRVESPAPGRSRYRARAENVHDFAWTAWPGFEQETRAIGETTVRVLSPPNTPLASAKTWETLTAALPLLSETYSPYPFESLTVVQTPRWATRAGGMEYPQFITTGGNDFVTLTGLKTQELLTVHELGHQWFQGLLASNEHAHPFLDEGLTSYLEWKYLDGRYGDGGLIDWPWLSVSRLALGRYSGLLFRKREPLSQSVTEFRNFGSLGSMVYARTPLCLETLGRVYGGEKLARALKRYASEFRFRHPKPGDLYTSLESELGIEARKNAEKMFEKAAFIDLSVDNVSSKKTPGGFESTATLAHSGTLELPFEVEFLLQDGSRKTVAAVSGPDTISVKLTHRSPIDIVVIDPSRSILLDQNFFNNRSRAPAPREQMKKQVMAVSLATWAGVLLGL